MQCEWDRFNGVTILADSIPDDASRFGEELATLQRECLARQGRIIWLHLPIERAHLIAIATGLGFVFHNCHPDQLTLVFTLRPGTFVPFAPTHTLGAGALVLNRCGELLTIREHGMPGYKLPGGHVELGEPIATAIEREVYEETGIHATLSSIAGFTTRYPAAFGRTDLYLICRLTAHSDQIAIQDHDEIADARWMTLSEYLQDERNAPFNRQLVAELHHRQGLHPTEPVNNQGPYRKQETFFATDWTGETTP
ncbi:NUDIX domain-containing protein [Pseudaeromonas sharmana]|uniref:NUDIX domain-containing protein n=1 Tax=Pseudaeromonas sharmana TaxID=328412 RepID=A0ABV8CRX2_9GAMM